MTLQGAALPTVRAFIAILCLLLDAAFAPSIATAQGTKPVEIDQRIGYIQNLFPAKPDGYGYGFSYYRAVWPLFMQPVAHVQAGLTTWLFPDNRGYSGDRELCKQGPFYHPGQNFNFSERFQSIEGGVGYWSNSSFPTTLPKYHLNGTSNCYASMVSSPGWGTGSKMALPDSQMAIVQLSNRLLIPPDGLTMDPGTNGQMLGIAWMAMPTQDVTASYYYRLRAQPLASQNDCLDANRRGAGAPLGGNAFMAPCTDSEEQYWQLIPSDKAGYFQLRSRSVESVSAPTESYCLAARLPRGKGDSDQDREDDGKGRNGEAYLAPCRHSPEQLWASSTVKSGGLTIRHLQTLQSQRQDLCLYGNNGSSSRTHGGAVRLVRCGSAPEMNWDESPVPPESFADAAKIPVGNVSWTLYLNTANFKGPVVYWEPEFYTGVEVDNPEAFARTLDIKPAYDRVEGIEFATVPVLYAYDSEGNLFTRIPPMQFPVDDQGRTILMEDFTAYSAKSWFQPTMAWLHGGAKPNSFGLSGAHKYTGCQPSPLNRLMQQRFSATDGSIIPVVGFDPVVSTAAIDPDHCAWGLQWTGSQQMTANGMAIFPEFYEQIGISRQVVPAISVPKSTGLAAAAFPSPGKPAPYSSPAPGSNSWNSPGPVAGPFEAHLSDGSTVTYFWYRFVDQPALQHLNLSEHEKQILQRRVEMIQANSPIDRNYFAPPSHGSLAKLDGALLVTPPTGLELGYVPIATSQAPSHGAVTGQ